MSSVPLDGGSTVSPAPDTICSQIELDLSAMIDGELDPASVRRVMVHSDVCESCRGFLQGIRAQARAHRDLSEVERAESGSASTLREQLMQNRQQLARILYELGRGYVLMGTSPGFSRVVAQEPVPIPDMSVRGRHFLDEVTRLVNGSTGTEWVRAKELFHRGDLRSPDENMAKGKRLLNEALMLDPDYHEARIYLGHAYHVSEEHELARREFNLVLELSSDAIIRAFALENLGNVYLEQGLYAESIPFFSKVVDSGVIGQEPRFFTIYFNLALANGLLEQFEACRDWLSRLHDEFPHKRRMIGEELRGREQLVSAIAQHPELVKRLAQDFPKWFSLPMEGTC